VDNPEAYEDTQEMENSINLERKENPQDIAR